MVVLHLVISSIFLAVVSAADSDPLPRQSLAIFTDYPVLQCTGCEMIAKGVGNRLNMSDGDTLLLGEENDEVGEGLFDNLCQEVRENSHFIVKDKIRMFSSASVDGRPRQQGKAYTQKEEEADLRDPVVAQLEELCEEIISNHKPIVASAAVASCSRRKKGLSFFSASKGKLKVDFNKLVDQMCKNGLQLCEQEHVGSGVIKEKGRYDDWTAAVKKERKAAKRKKKQGRSKKQRQSDSSREDDL